MGKSRGGKYPKAGHSKSRGPRKTAADDDEEGTSEEEVPQQRGVGNQRANVGMLPPSDSDEEEAEGGAKPEAGKTAEASTSKPAEPAKQAAAPAKKAAAAAAESDDDSDSDDDDDDDPTPEYLRAAPTARKKEPVVEPRSEEQIRKDLERLELIRKKREDDRLKRIATEGWDRYAPVTASNKPPGHYVPEDHPEDKS